MQSAVPVLQLVMAQTGNFQDLGVNAPLSLSLLSGECALIEGSDAAQLAAFADLCSGLITLNSGNARFIGRDWSDLPHDYAAALRGRIGRVFATGGWVPFLDVEPNVRKPKLHHPRRDLEELRQEAQGLAREFGLPGLPLALQLRLNFKLIIAEVLAHFSMTITDESSENRAAAATT